MKVMVFDVGGTEIKYSVMDDTMNYYESGSVSTPSDSQEHFLETMAEIYRPHRDEVDGIALSLPGFIDAEHGVVKGGGAPSIVYNIGTPVGPRLAEKCGCKVWIENDGKAAAIAELQRGVLKGCSNAAVFIIGTGVGGGLIVNGQLVRGRGLYGGGVQLHEHQRRRVEQRQKDHGVPVQHHGSAGRLPGAQGSASGRAHERQDLLRRSQRRGAGGAGSAGKILLCRGRADL